MTKDIFKSLLDSILQCICDLWDAADSPERKQLLVQQLEELIGQLRSLQNLPSGLAPGRTLFLHQEQLAGAFPSLSNEAREMLSVILTAIGLLEKHELKMTPKRRAEEFRKIRDAIQDFARLLDEAAI